MSDEKQNPKSRLKPGKYDQTRPELAHLGHVPGEPVKVIDPKNRRKILGSNREGIASGTAFDPFSIGDDE